MIRARTDAAATDGIPEVIDRLNLYGEAGADIVFADALLSVEDIATVAKNVNKPLAVNMGFGLIERGTTPLVTPRKLQELGVATVSYARMLTSAALRGMMNALAAFAPTITADKPAQHPELMVPFGELNDLMGLKTLEQLEARWTQRMILLTEDTHEPPGQSHCRACSPRRLLALAPAPAPALDNIEIMAPAAPGGGYDRTSRALQATIEKEGLGKNITVINVGGAGGAIGLAQFIRNKSGRSDAMIVGGFGMVASFTTNRSKVTLADVTPLARLTGEYNIVVVPTKSPIKSLKDLVELVKKGPSAVSWAGGSAGGNDHMLAASIVQSAGIDPRQTNYIAFSGGGDSLASIIGGQVTVGVGGYSELIEQVKAGNLRALGISATDRVPGIDMPTLREQGVDVTFSNWRGVAAPPKLSARAAPGLSHADRQGGQIAELEGPSGEERLGRLLSRPATRSAEYIAEETKRVTALLTTLGLIK